MTRVTPYSLVGASANVSEEAAAHISRVKKIERCEKKKNTAASSKTSIREHEVRSISKFTSVTQMK
jgi:hypothetical protein